MALSKGKKILIAVVAGVVAIGTTIGVVLGIQNSKDPGPGLPSIDTPVDPNPDTPVDPTPDDPVDPTPDDPVDPTPDDPVDPTPDDPVDPTPDDPVDPTPDDPVDPTPDDPVDPTPDDPVDPTPDEPVDPTPDDPVDPTPDDPVDPDPGEEEPETPETPEEEYYKENLGLLKTAIVEEYRKDFGDFADASLKIDESQEIVINEAAGEIYFFGDRIDIFGGSSDLFFVAKFDKNILSETQKNLNSILRSETRSFDINFEFIKTIRSNLSEDVYKEFENFLCSQSYDSNGETKTFSNEAVVLDVSRYISGDAYGGKYIQFMIVDGEKVYTARLENAMPPEVSDWGIEQIMGYSNNVFKITEIKDFKEFDYEEEAAQAQSEFFLDLSEVAISKDQAQDLANAIRTSNPKKLGNMEVKLPAENPDFEL